MTYQEDAQKIVMNFMDRLRKAESVEYGILSDEWQKIAAMLQADIDKLASGKYPTLDKLYSSTFWANFQRRALALSAQYAEISNGVITTGQREFALAGLQSAQVSLGAFGVNFRVLNIDAANIMIGATQNGTPLFEILTKRFGENANKVADTLVYANARGIGPLETARLIGADLEGNKWKAIQIARTEQINAFRDLQRQQYAESGIVKGIEWIAEPDACEICLAGAAGSPYPVDFVIDPHPNCRCGSAPIV